MDSIPKKRRRLSTTDFDVNKCIICQRDRPQATTSSVNGRMSIKNAARIRNDTVKDRLFKLENNYFVYHVSNECYKSYTLKKTLSSATKNVQTYDENNNNNNFSNPKRVSRSKVKPSSKVSPDEYQNKTTCIICNNIRHKGEYVKSKISGSSLARKVLRVTIYFKDDVYIRTCDLQDEYRVFGANLFYHKNCMRKYIKKYDDIHACTNNTSHSFRSHRENVFVAGISEINEMLKSGNTIHLSDVRQKLNQSLQVNSYFTNRDLRMLLMDYYGDDVYFSRPSQSNKSAIVKLYSTTNTEEFKSLYIVEDAAKILREEIICTDFNLSDKFCDSNDIRQAWTGTCLPNAWCKFFNVLFNPNGKTECDSKCQEFDKNCDDVCTSRTNDNTKQSDDGVDIEDEDGNLEHNDTTDDSEEFEVIVNDRKTTRTKALFQVIYFNVHYGRKRTPLHIMNAQSIYDKCKSRDLITSLNHFGLSISYNELQKYHKDMASYVVEISKGSVPMPSHFDTQTFTLAAFDNFDHEEATLSGIGGSHDTVSVLYQEKSTAVRRKPTLSETGIIHGTKPFQEQLRCQSLRPYTRPFTKPALKVNFKVDDDLPIDNTDMLSVFRKQDVAWTLARLNTPDLIETNFELQREQVVPSWSAFNSLVSQENLKQMSVGFLPVIPHPVTDYQTVYTALQNFQDVLKQLNQTHLPVTCDEGVYRIAREIIMDNPNHFDNIVLCLGSFHMAKIFLGAIGKYLRNSGAENIWTENAVFGPNVVQSVLTGSHYVRSFKGMLLLCETMERLQWTNFLETYATTANCNQLQPLFDLRNSVSRKEPQESTCHLELFLQSSTKMFEDFDSYRSENCKASETFKYWDHFIELVRLLRNLVRADREGNWLLHLSTVKSILPYFAVFDNVNYLRWCSLYLEDMKMLPETAPEVYKSFCNGQFVVKQTTGKFKAVGADQCLEQTINRSQKTSGGIIGTTRKKDFVTEWEIIYHEMLAVCNLHREVSGTKTFQHELTVHHEFTKSEIDARDKNISDMIKYIQHYENPFNVHHDTEIRLHNIVTQEVMSDDIRQSLLKIKEKGLEQYNSFRQERLIKKKIRLSEPIHRNNVKTFSSINTDSNSKVKLKGKKRTDVVSGHRYLEICQARGHSTKELFKYDLVESSGLFDQHGLIKKTTKSELCRQLEKFVVHNEDSTPVNCDGAKTVWLVDVMANIRKVNHRGMSTFGNLCQAFFEMIIAICSNAYRIDFVFDSYIERSVKDTERLRRCNKKPIEISTITRDTPLPVNIDTFWTSGNNKAKLQSLLRKWILDNANTEKVEIVLSGTMLQSSSAHCNSICQNVQVHIPELDLAIEEADVRLIPHALHAIRQGAESCVLLSNDTDVMVLGLHFYDEFKSNGLCQMWIRAGTGNSTRFIPLHQIAEKTPQLCRVVLAAHILTGCDVTSKVGTKLAALKAKPELYLNDFGNSLESEDIENAIRNSEKYLVNVLRQPTKCTTMDELRYHIYHTGKAVDLSDLPPTSTAIRSHIQRSLYAYFMQSNCLKEVHLNPIEFGFEEMNGLLLPSVVNSPIPRSIVQVCNCKACTTKRCTCRKAGIQCCIYCVCQSNGSNTLCKNPHIVFKVPIVM